MSRVGRAVGPLSIFPRSLRARVLVLAVAVAVAAAATMAVIAQVAGAAGSRVRPDAAPIAVDSATLTQSGRDLVWTVDLDAPFSPAALAPAQRSLCLLIERRRGGVVAGQLCVLGPPRGGRSARLAYAPVTAAGAGPASVIPATVARAGVRSLTATFAAAAIGNRYQTLRWQVSSALADPPCAGACVTLFPAVPALAPLHVPRLVGCTATGPPLVNGGSMAAGRREIALTFDDGPWVQTPQFLALLERDEVPATFFEIGRQISEYGEDGAIERRMLADGDMIGDHTWSHPDVAGAGAFADEQIEQAAAAIRTATGGFTPCLFRAPYGDVSPALIAEARSLGFTTIQWDIDPRDWALPGVTEIETNVIDNARPGGIVELHDGGGDRSETLAALPDIIDTLRARGYTFVTVTQLLGQTLLYR
jgi:peptidoglycan/xylan/chitin deacetylase (PgdA/CDA1 family)